ncbi:MAG: FAD-linked oxidoreductase, partial [Actinomycetota bacterium]|nr:FAD-linked oxidoreductase [Actinomycetota bacterium]
MGVTGITRRSFLGTAAAIFGAAVLPGRAAAVAGAQKATWPSKVRWARLNAQVGGRLIQPVTPWSALKSAIIPARLKNPWYLEEQPGATQSTGMFQAWTSTASTQAVAVEINQDIVAAVNFARENKVRIV